MLVGQSRCCLEQLRLINARLGQLSGSLNLRSSYIRIRGSQGRRSAVADAIRFQSLSEVLETSAGSAARARGRATEDERVGSSGRETEEAQKRTFVRIFGQR